MARLGHHHGVRDLCVEPSVHGITAGRALIAPGAHQPIGEAGQFEQSPQEKAFPPVAIDDIRAVLP